MKIETGEIVILTLHSPREKLWGIVQEINSAGVYIRGIDLNAFNDFIRAAKNDEYIYGLSNIFFPLWRVERLVRDEQDGEIIPLYEQFESQTGLRIEEI